LRFRRRGILPAGLALAFLGLMVVGPTTAAGNAFRIDLPSSAVGAHARFFVRIVQQTAIATSGAQATLAFDPSLLQVTTVQARGPYAAAPIFLGGNDAAIAAANASGRLSTVAAAFLPPGSVPAGSAEFLEIGLRAVGCGQADLELPAGPADAMLLDGTDRDYGETLTVDSTSGAVMIDCSKSGGDSGGRTADAARQDAGGGPASSPDSSIGGAPWTLLGFGLVVLGLLAGSWWFMRSRA
jgi:hypothetical protein